MEVCSHGGMDPKTILLKLNGTRCNLACKYCIETPKMLGRRMSLNYIERLFSDLPEDVSIILHGGEPLLDAAYVEQVLKLFIGLRKGTIGIQTNGVFPQSMFDVLFRYSSKIRLGISVDGPAECNKSRVSSSGKQMFGIIDHTIDTLSEHGIPIKCIATIAKDNINDPLGFIHYFASKSNLRQLRVNPCFSIPRNGAADVAISPLQFLSFLKVVSTEWIQDGLYRQFRLDPTQSFAERILSGRPIPDKKCKQFVSVYSDGVCTLCDALGRDSFICKDWKTLFDQVGCLYDHGLQATPCGTCSEVSTCDSGCPASFLAFGTSISDYCQYRRAFASFVRETIGRDNQ